MTTYIRADLRRLIHSRAGGKCEYCLMDERDTYLGCQVDHVISEKHGGLTDAANLALACAFCNRAKGSDIDSHDEVTGEFVRFFNPRTDRWTDHFEIEGTMFKPKSTIGRVTAAILRLNLLERLLERQALFDVGRSPLLQ